MATYWRAMPEYRYELRHIETPDDTVEIPDDAVGVQTYTEGEGVTVSFLEPVDDSNRSTKSETKKR